ncbi:MAG TPA: ferredoxin family protein [Steroidobacteraceae bacterium]|nr:ferredoxin family protein [Steroidobacteraceae bacterium]
MSALPKSTECKQEPGTFRPVIDRGSCEGKADCVRVCPVGVFLVGTLPKELRAGLSIKGKLKGFAHRWQQALLVNEAACEACGQCVSACPEKAITLERAP